MRLWSLHPKYLDRPAILAVWREGLLAKKVLEGKTKGYRNHPQLERFKKHPRPLYALCLYLLAILEEARIRNYKFNEAKICPVPYGHIPKITVSTGQIDYELSHLKKKAAKRSPGKYLELSLVSRPLPNPIFKVVKGKIAPWEKVTRH